MKTRVALGLWLWALTALGTALAQDRTGIEEREIRLANLVRAGESIDLRTSASEFSLFVPIAERWNVQQARLHLEFTNSISLLKDRSQLRVVLNGKPLAQFALRQDQPNTAADINIPVALLKPGFNRLQFEVAQHYTLQCEEPTAAELWTQVDAWKSTLTVAYNPQPVTASLATLSRYIDRKAWGNYELNIATVGEEPSDNSLAWGAAVAQSAALRLDYLPLNLTHARAQERAIRVEDARKYANYRFPLLDQSKFAGRDTVLLGTAEELAPLLGNEFTKDISKAFLAIYPLDDDPNHFLLIVSGTAAEDVQTAARAIGFSDFPFPDQATTTITQYQVPKLAKYSARKAIELNSSYKFADFGFKTATFRGNKISNMEQAEISFWLPPDAFTIGREDVRMVLHLAYGAGMRADSVVNLLINNRFERAIRLSDVEGGIYRDYQLTLPLQAFAPGPNLIVFQPRVQPLIADYCARGDAGNLLLTVFDDSTINFPEATHYVKLPDLALFAKTGFPYNAAPGSDKLFVQASSRDFATTAAAWTVIAKLAQTADIPLVNLKTGFSAPATDSDAIIVGSAGTIDKQWLKGAGMVLGEQNQITLPVAASVPGGPARPNYWQQVFNDFKAIWSGGENLGTRDTEQPAARMEQSGTLGSYKALLQYQSPTTPTRTVTVLTASDQRHLLEGVQSLVSPEIWDNLKGDTVLWQKQAESLRAFAAVPAYHLGEASVSKTLSYFFSAYPLVALGMIIVVILAMALILRWIVYAFRRKHHTPPSDF